MVTVFGTALRFDGKHVELGEPVDTLVTTDDTVIAVVEPGSSGDRNVVAFDRDGTKRWEIVSPPHDLPPSDGRTGPSYRRAWVADGELWVHSTTRYRYRIDIETGTIEASVPERELRTSHGTVRFEHPIKRFVRTDGVTVVLLGRGRNDDGSLGDAPGPRNVVGVVAESERWRIKTLGLTDRTHQLWSGEDSPRPLQPSNRYEDIWLEDDQLVVKHRFGTEAVVDPRTGSVRIRGVSFVNDRGLFGPDRIVELPDPVWEHRTVDGKVVAVLGIHRTGANWSDRNVLAFDHEGNRCWRIGGYESGGEAEKVYIRHLWQIDDRLLARRPDRRSYEVDLATGEIRRHFGPTKLPIGDRVIAFPAEIASAVDGGDTVVVCLRWRSSDDAEPASAPTTADNQQTWADCTWSRSRNIVALDSQGTERWRIEPTVDDDVYTGVSTKGDRLRATTFGGKHLDVDWETGEISRNSNRLW